MIDTKKVYLQKIRDLINSNENILKSKEFLTKIIESDIYIYGAGNAGAVSYQQIKRFGVEIKGFIDKNAENIKTYKEKKVYTLDCFKVDKKDNTIIIIAYICSYKDIKEISLILNDMGYYNIHYFHDIYNLTMLEMFHLNRLQNDASKSIFDVSIQKKILEVAGMLSDTKSRSVYYNFLSGIIEANPDLFSKPDSTIQYFVDDIEFSKGYDRFIDCGAFNGDTALILNQNKGKIQKIAMFEPEMGNLKNLKQNLENVNIAEEEILFPCGVWDKTEMIRFNSGFQSTSTITEDGLEFIQCISLDDALFGFKPTFIKMDIEGAEYKAILGAKKTIQENTPDLAISVYHKIEDMWEIPLLIKTFNKSYNLYLRCHGLHGMETIMYAVNKE